MLKVRFKGLIIEYPNHENLLSAKEKLLYFEINKELQGLENVKECGYSYINLDRNNYLLLYNNPDLEQKTHLYVYNVPNKVFTKEIDCKVFEKLYSSRVIIKHKIKEISLNKERKLELIPNLKDTLNKMSMESIKYRSELLAMQKERSYREPDKRPKSLLEAFERAGTISKEKNIVKSTNNHSYEYER